MGFRGVVLMCPALRLWVLEVGIAGGLLAADQWGWGSLGQVGQGIRRCLVLCQGLCLGLPSWLLGPLPCPVHRAVVGRSLAQSEGSSCKASGGPVGRRRGSQANGLADPGGGQVGVLGRQWGNPRQAMKDYKMTLHKQPPTPFLLPFAGANPAMGEQTTQE